MKSPIKVLYIAGPTRSGSTLLGNMLGEVRGVFNAGEVIDLWDRGILEGGRCGCGSSVPSCDVWRQVLEDAFGDLSQVDLPAMVRIRDREAHSRRVPWLLWAPGAAERLRSRVDEYISNLEKLYAAIQAITRCAVVVDASKNLGYAFVLAMSRLVDVYLVHMIRDPRATAYSWRRKKEGLRQDSPLQTALVWDSRNMAAELLGNQWRQRYTRVHYEDFVRRPEQTVSTLLEFVNQEPGDLPFIEGSDIVLGVNHSIYGNPNRFAGGRVPLQLDDEWRTGISTSDHLLTTTLTLPLLLRYGYPLRTRQPR